MEGHVGVHKSVLPFPPYPEFLAPGNSPLPRRVLFFLNRDGVLELK